MSQLFVNNNTVLRRGDLTADFESEAFYEWVDKLNRLPKAILDKEGLNLACINRPTIFGIQMLSMAAKLQNVRYAFTYEPDVTGFTDCSGLCTFYMKTLVGFGDSWAHGNAPMYYDEAKELDCLIRYEDAIKTPGNILLIQAQENFEVARNSGSSWGNAMLGHRHHFGHAALSVDGRGMIIQSGYEDAHPIRDGWPGDSRGGVNISTIQITGPNTYCNRSKMFPDLPPRIGIDTLKFVMKRKLLYSNALMPTVDVNGFRSLNQQLIDVFFPTKNKSKQAKKDVAEANRAKAKRTSTKAEEEEEKLLTPTPIPIILEVPTVAGEDELPPLEPPLDPVDEDAVVVEGPSMKKNLKESLDKIDTKMECGSEPGYDHALWALTPRFGVDPLTRDLTHLFRMMLYARSCYRTHKNMLLTSYHKNFVYHMRITRESLARVLREDLSQYLNYRRLEHNKNLTRPDERSESVKDWADSCSSRNIRDRDEDRKHLDLTLTLKMLSVCNFTPEKPIVTFKHSKSDIVEKEKEDVLTNISDNKYSKILFGNHSIVGVDSYTASTRGPVLGVSSVIINEATYRQNVLNDKTRIVLNDSDIERTDGKVAGVRVPRMEGNLSLNGYKELLNVFEKKGSTNQNFSFFSLLLMGLDPTSWTDVNLTEHKDLWDSALSKVLACYLAQCLVDYVRVRFDNFAGCNITEFIFLPKYRDNDSYDEICFYRPNLLLTILNYKAFKGKELFINDVSKLRDRQAGMTISFKDNATKGSSYVMDVDDLDGSPGLMNYF